MKIGMYCRNVFVILVTTSMLFTLTTYYVTTDISRQHSTLSNTNFIGKSFMTIQMIKKKAETEYNDEVDISNVDWKKILPNTISPDLTGACEDMFNGKAKEVVNTCYRRYYRLHAAELGAVHKKFKGTLEGHTGTKYDETALYFTIAPNAKTVCEIGFNAGHSAIAWMCGSNHTVMYFFDIGTHPYSRPMAAFLQTLFPGRIHTIWGDSAVTVPVFALSDVKCDVLVIDGGHTKTAAKADLENMRLLARNSRNNVLVFDDYPCNDTSYAYYRDLDAVWNQGVSEKKVETYYKCYMRSHYRRGFTIGRFLNEVVK